MLVFAARIMAQGTGLYDISDSIHPRPLTDQIGKVKIFSVSNDNRSYNINIDALRSFSLPRSKIALIAGNETIGFWGNGVDEKGECNSLETTVYDPGVIPLIAQYFHVDVVNRRHPGYQMLVEYTPDKPAFALGDAVVVTLRITNVGTNDFTFIEGGRQRGARDNQFAFSAEHMGGKVVHGVYVGEMLPDIGDPMNWGGVGVTVKLKPGRTREIKVDLNKWFHFEPKSQYSIRGSYYIEFVNSNDMNFVTIWEDYACAEFMVKIK